ncbi:SsgA family sporulation/cell division regulator [Streptomyces sp. NPDC046925]|uniref:SsgA family sporulation/cell division regulator n=1 Tax=Streptomyces sp. NPDC046925 TaxID=3155375 RepID=UPI0033CE27C9
MIIQPVALELILDTGHLTPLAAELRYSPDDPYAVTLDITRPDDTHAVWTFARDLLADGISAVGTVGEGDVMVRRHSTDAVTVHLSTPEGTADFVIDPEAVATLLCTSYVMVPEGMERDHMDMDAELAREFGEAA